MLVIAVQQIRQHPDALAAFKMYRPLSQHRGAGPFFGVAIGMDPRYGLEDGVIDLDQLGDDCLRSCLCLSAERQFSERCGTF